MKKSRSNLALILVLVVLGWLAWKWWSGKQPEGDAEADAGRALFYDRVWIDHMPKSETDPLHVFAALTEEPVGIFQLGSMWQGQWELFRHEPRGDGKLIALFPQAKEKEQLSYRAFACRENKFDYCLDVAGTKRGAKRYYSNKGWEVGRSTTVQLVDRVDHVLGAVLPATAE